MSVPFGYSGFFLAGLSGTVTEGTIIIERNSEKDKEKFIITYRNMKLKK